MAENCDDFEVLLSGLVDGELTEEEQRRLDSHLAECAHCQRELDALRRMVVGTSLLLHAPAVPEETWERFADDVYNRVERRGGWIIFIVGAVLLLLFGIFQFVTQPWGSALLKVLVAAPLMGLGVLLMSVLRERLHALKHDRYTREVHR